jgi:hypothetical protein
VHKGEPDPRGWSVLNAAGRKIGEVKDLMVDTTRMVATYLDVELDDDSFDLRDDPHVLVPVDHARREPGHKRLVVADLDDETVGQLCAARQRHHLQFWDTWWRGSRSTAPAPAPAQPDAGMSPTSATRINHAVETVRPGETVHIPVVNEEIIVERRPLHQSERVVARATGEHVAPRDERTR